MFYIMLLLFKLAHFNGKNKIKQIVFFFLVLIILFAKMSWLFAYFHLIKIHCNILTLLRFSLQFSIIFYKTIPIISSESNACKKSSVTLKDNLEGSTAAGYIQKVR